MLASLVSPLALHLSPDRALDAASSAADSSHAVPARATSLSSPISDETQPGFRKSMRSLAEATRLSDASEVANASGVTITVTTQTDATPPLPNPFDPLAMANNTATAMIDPLAMMNYTAAAMKAMGLPFTQDPDAAIKAMGLPTVQTFADAAANMTKEAPTVDEMNAIASAAAEESTKAWAALTPKPVITMDNITEIVNQTSDELNKTAQTWNDFSVAATEVYTGQYKVQPDQFVPPDIKNFDPVGDYSAGVNQTKDEVKKLTQTWSDLSAVATDFYTGKVDLKKLSAEAGAPSGAIR